MPFINGKFYANPAHGEALEKAKAVDSQHAAAKKQTAPVSNSGKQGKQTATPGHQKPKVENEAAIGNRVYNETGGLRPKAGVKPGDPGSAEDLHNARVAMSDVARNREKEGTTGGIAHNRVIPIGQKTAQYKDAQAAALEAARSSDVTKGSGNFYLDYGQGPPNWAEGKKMTSYGPFKNASGGGDVPTGADVRIVIVH